MTDSEQHRELTSYFETRYEVAARYPFAADRRILLRDHEDEASQRCRYCGSERSKVTFRKDAHAFPDFLGNRSVFSMNDCDDCNDFFGKGCENHLSKQTMLARTLVGVPRKKSKNSTFKSNDETLRIDSNGSEVNIRVPAPNSPDELLIDGNFPEVIQMTGDTASQPYVPIQAAMALVKIACSVCPKEDLGQCQTAIAWLLGRRLFRFSELPVSYAFTPGPILDEKLSEVVLLRRIGDGAEPYLWCVVRFRNVRLQVFVPGCPADDNWSRGGREVTFMHYPFHLSPNWPYGRTNYSWLDWSGTKSIRSTAKVSHHVSQFNGFSRDKK